MRVYKTEAIKIRALEFIKRGLLAGEKLQSSSCAQSPVS